MPFNRNLIHLNRSLNRGNRGSVLEGASRSGKTWAGIDFMIGVLDHLYPGSEIIIVRETYNSFKTTLYSDFNRRLPMWEIKSPFEGIKELGTFWLPNRSKVMLMGADNPAKYHGAGSDFFFINEALDVPQSVFDQLEQRCRRFWWMDYNPKVSDHWIYNSVCTREDVTTFHSTFLDNPEISEPERRKIMSYDPSNPANIQSGTADDYMWKVYGLGLRAAPEGLIFEHVSWVDRFPDNIELITYGIDFGYTQDPTALVKVGRDGMNLYIQKLIYTPIDNADDLAATIKQVVPGDRHIWGDSSDPAMISDLRIRGITCLAVKKFPGSIIYGIDLLKRFKLNLVRDRDLQKEAENYKWREINGIRLNEPIDKFNHCWDAVRYCSMSEFRVC